jgi:hypothetical protein
MSMALMKIQGFSDESHHNVGRYRSVAVVSLAEQHSLDCEKRLRATLRTHRVSEFAWKNLRSADLRNVAIKWFGIIFDFACLQRLRIDVLCWDTHDRRHSILGRDDIENLHRMYYHLLKYVCTKRWPNEARWTIYPDEQSELRWSSIEEFLNYASEGRTDSKNMFTGLSYTDEFHCQEFIPQKSDERPLVQVADLFAGMAVYSCLHHERFLYWLRDGEPRLFAEVSPVNLTPADRERCRVLDSLDRSCQKFGFGVSLRTNRRLQTYEPDRPKRPINFWWYEAQHENDRAPTRKLKIR